jgi:hypothetical protein
MDLNIDGNVLRDWHRRTILEADPVGKGNERQYTFEQLVFTLSLILVQPYLESLAEAKYIAGLHARKVVEVYLTGPDPGAVERCPPQLLKTEMGGYPELTEVKPGATAEKLARQYFGRGATLFHPGQFALHLGTRIGEVLAIRRGLPSGRVSYSAEELGEG